MGAVDGIRRGADRVDGAVGDKAVELSDHTWFQRCARVGFAVSGLVNILIGIIAFQLAFGDSSQTPDQSGALKLVEVVPGGEIILWVCAVAAALLAIWFVIDGFAQRHRQSSDRDGTIAFWKRVGTAVIYVALAVGIIGVLQGSGGNTEQTADQTSTSLIGTWWGATLIVIAGLAIAGVGVYFIVRGVRKKFTETLDLAGAGRMRKFVIGAGVVGHVARGVSFIIMGALAVIAVITRDPEAVSGLGGTLQTIAGQPYGPVLLAAIGVGLCVYGVYMGFRARFENLDRTV